MNYYKNKRDDALTADWLRQNGLNEKTFVTDKLHVARAATMASTLLNEHGELLTKRDVHSLTDFMKAANNKRERQRITNSFCYCVMNINARINRKLFKQYRRLEQQAST